MAAFDGGRLTSDGGVLLLSLAERRFSLAERLARLIPDRRDPTRVTHSVADMIRARIFAICCGYEDADDLDSLRTDPAFKLACGRLPDAGADLCSQPTLSRLESAPGLRDVIRLCRAAPTMSQVPSRSQASAISKLCTPPLYTTGVPRPAARTARVGSALRPNGPRPSETACGMHSYPLGSV